MEAPTKMSKMEYYSKFYHTEWHFGKELIVFHNNMLLNPVFHPEDITRNDIVEIDFQKDVPKRCPVMGDCLTYVEIKSGSPTKCKVSSDAPLFEFDLKTSKNPLIILFHLCHLSSISLQFDSNAAVALHYRTLPPSLSTDHIYI